MDGHSLGSHIMLCWSELSCIVVELPHSCLSFLTILEREGYGRAGVLSHRGHPGIFSRPTSFPLLLRAGRFDLFHPGMTIPCSPCLHGHGSIRGCSLGGHIPLARCLGSGCRSLCLLCEHLGLTGADLWPRGRHTSSQVWAHVKLTLSSYHTMEVASHLDPPRELVQSLQVDPSDH